jgi:hypothetical protein
MALNLQEVLASESVKYVLLLGLAALVTHISNRWGSKGVIRYESEITELLTYDRRMEKVAPVYLKESDIKGVKADVDKFIQAGNIYLVEIKAYNIGYENIKDLAFRLAFNERYKVLDYKVGPQSEPGYTVEVTKDGPNEVVIKVPYLKGRKTINSSIEITALLLNDSRSLSSSIDRMFTLKPTSLDLRRLIEEKTTFLEKAMVGMLSIAFVATLALAYILDIDSNIRGVLNGVLGIALFQLGKDPALKWFKSVKRWWFRG